MFIKVHKSSIMRFFLMVTVIVLLGDPLPAHAHAETNRFIVQDRAAGTGPGSTDLQERASSLVPSDPSSLPQVHVSTPSYPIAIDSRESQLVPFSFAETGNASGRITSQTFRFYTQYDVPLVSRWDLIQQM